MGRKFYPYNKKERGIYSNAINRGLKVGREEGTADTLKVVLAIEANRAEARFLTVILMLAGGIMVFVIGIKALAVY